MASPLWSQVESLGRLETLGVVLFTVLCFVVTEAPGLLPLHQREVPLQTLEIHGETVTVKHLLLDHSYLSDLEQRCPVWLLLLLCILVPLGSIIGGISLARRQGDAVAFVHGYLLAMACMEVTVNVVKNYCGYLRPYFYEECDFDLASGACLHDKDDAHKSFPSGHASYSFCAMLYTSLYLLGKVNAANARPLSLGAQGPRVDCTNAFLLASLLPLAIAAWIAASRVADNDHHPADVATGAAIGAAWASFWYGRYYPSIWADDSDVPGIGALNGAKPVSQEEPPETFNALMGV